MQRARAGGADRAPERSGAASRWDSQARRRVGSYGRSALRAGCGVTGCTVLRWEMGAAAGHGPGGRLGGSACDLRRCKSVTPRMSGQARAGRCSCSSRRETRGANRGARARYRCVRRCRWDASERRDGATIRPCEPAHHRSHCTTRADQSMHVGSRLTRARWHRTHHITPVPDLRPLHHPIPIPGPTTQTHSADTPAAFIMMSPQRAAGDPRAAVLHAHCVIQRSGE